MSSCEPFQDVLPRLNTEAFELARNSITDQSYPHRIMLLTLPSVALLLPALFDNNIVSAACMGKNNQIHAQDGGKWNLTGFASTGCGQHSTAHSNDDDQGCHPINGGVSSLSFRFDGINKFKVCLWGDADCSHSFYRGSSIGDKDQTCRNVINGFTVDAFTVVNITKPCFIPALWVMISLTGLFMTKLLFDNVLIVLVMETATALFLSFNIEFCTHVWY